MIGEAFVAVENEEVVKDAVNELGLNVNLMDKTFNAKLVSVNRELGKSSASLLILGSCVSLQPI